MTTNSILVSSVRSNKSENNVWAVYVQGQEENKSYCKSPYKAMRYAFFLKKMTGCRIADNSLALLSLEIQKKKVAGKQEHSELAQNAEQEQARPKGKEASLTPEQREAKARIDEAVEQFVEDHSVDNVLAKADEAKRKRRSKKSEAAAAEAEPSKPKARRQSKASKKQEEVAE